MRTSNYEGPSTITYLVPQEAAKRGIETRTFVVHLPQYFQVDEDLNGTARLMEILCNLYQLPDRLIEPGRGREQYSSIEGMVGEEGGRWLPCCTNWRNTTIGTARRRTAAAAPLSANIEEFLRDLNHGFDPPPITKPATTIRKPITTSRYYRSVPGLPLISLLAVLDRRLAILAPQPFFAPWTIFRYETFGPMLFVRQSPTTLSALSALLALFGIVSG